MSLNTSVSTHGGTDLVSDNPPPQLLTHQHKREYVLFLLLCIHSIRANDELGFALFFKTRDTYPAYTLGWPVTIARVDTLLNDGSLPETTLELVNMLDAK